MIDSLSFFQSCLKRNNQKNYKIFIILDTNNKTFIIIVIKF